MLYKNIFDTLNVGIMTKKPTNILLVINSNLEGEVISLIFKLLRKQYKNVKLAIISRKSDHPDIDEIIRLYYKTQSNYCVITGKTLFESDMHILSSNGINSLYIDDREENVSMNLFDNVFVDTDKTLLSSNARLVFNQLFASPLNHNNIPIQHYNLNEIVGWVDTLKHMDAVLSMKELVDDKNIWKENYNNSIKLKEKYESKSKDSIFSTELAKQYFKYYDCI